ncbi:hypothetical protein PORCRE_1559 [Porphyromonas crevioricanis JCM 15906]|uniref:Uncharacterized protein n=1 Tax=Porphyromonas crevioricanis JCM 15906 TaxID=1305617 RepID=T1DSS9_9PORP|nr:hypothetical protein PORCRE_1559 [Porphyromonas crevioricanis JCM 15906]GAD08002.1 hypothetical protein PORCAN_1632 [Porphyromonas crevioricanis JCM 13913]
MSFLSFCMGLVDSFLRKRKMKLLHSVALMGSSLILEFVPCI